MNEELPHKIKASKLLELPEKLTGGVPAYVIIVLIFAAVYVGSVGYGYSEYKDDRLIEDRKEFLTGFDNLAVKIFGDKYIAESGDNVYRPIRTLSYITDMTLGGGSTTAFRITNIVLMILITCFLFVLLKRLGYDPLLSLLISAAAGVNTFFINAVLWLPARGDLLFVLFAILSIISFIDFADEGGALNFTLNMVFYALALFSKESAFILPFVYLSYLFIYKRRQIFVVEDISLYVIWLAISLTYYFLRSAALSDITASELSGPAEMLHNTAGVPYVFGKMLLPVGSAFLPQYDALSVILGCAIILILGIRIYMKRNKNKSRITFATVFCILFCLPYVFSGNGFNGYGFDIYTNRALACGIGIVVLSLELLPSAWKVRGKTLPAALAAVSVIFYSASTLIKSGEFASPELLHESTIAINPDCIAARLNYAAFLAEKGDNDGAIGQYRAATDKKPDCTEAYMNTAKIEFLKGDRESAEQDFDKALKSDQRNASALKMRAEIRYFDKRYDEAVADLDAAVRIDSKDAEIYNLRGMAFSAEKNFSRALSDFAQAVKLNPSNTAVYKNRAAVYIELKDFVSACADLDRVGSGDSQADSLRNISCPDKNRNK